MIEHNDFDIVIVGAGITGLAAGFYAKLLAAQAAQSPTRVLLLESSDRVGGKIQSESSLIGETESFLLEWGADSMLSTKPEGLELVRLLGLDTELIETTQERQIFMLRDRKLVAMPQGLQLVIPKRLWPFLISPLFSWQGKLRMGLDLLLPARNSSEDESISSFMRRRLGQEALDLLAEPILSGIYSADPERQSLQATFMQLAELERKHRSLIIGALRSKPAPGPANQPRSLFVSFKRGMQTLTDALSKQLAGELRLNSKVENISQEATGSWRVALAGGESIAARRVIVTSPASVSATLLKDAAPRAAALLQNMRQTSSGCAYLAFKKSDVPHPLNGYGILIPKVENRAINAVTWVSSKMEGRSPSSHILFRVFFGGERHPEMMERDDSEIIEIVLREVAALHGIRAQPVLAKVFRSVNGNPQYDVGHLERIAQIEKELPSGLIVTGCAMRGVGIPDCIRQGKKAATRALE